MLSANAKYPAGYLPEYSIRGRVPQGKKMMYGINEAWHKPGKKGI